MTNQYWLSLPWRTNLWYELQRRVMAGALVHASRAERLRNLARMGIFGSYGRGAAGFGSDLDLLLVDEQVCGGQVERVQRWPLAELPLSCDALVLTSAELEQRLIDGSRMAAELSRDLRWVFERSWSRYVESMRQRRRNHAQRLVSSSAKLQQPRRWSWEQKQSTRHHPSA